MMIHEAPETGFKHEIAIVTLTPSADPFDQAQMLEADRLKRQNVQGMVPGTCLMTILEF